MSKALIEQLANLAVECGATRMVAVDVPRIYTYTFHLDELEAMCKAYAQTQGQSVQETHKLAPREPSDEMCTKARELTGISANAAYHVYKVMINAAPIESEVKGNGLPIAEKNDDKFYR